jgi:hypothetical protein
MTPDLGLVLAVDPPLDALEPALLNPAGEQVRLDPHRASLPADDDASVLAEEALEGLHKL